jgi:pyruvate dehydrogenase E2 component (dihydrolipoamide acetyltransferase)
MIYKLVVPPFGELREMKVLAWRKRPSAEVAPGEALAELETDKAVIEVVAERHAVLRTIEVDEGDWHALGSALALLSTDLDEDLRTAETAEPMPASFDEL